MAHVTPYVGPVSMGKAKNNSYIMGSSKESRGRSPRARSRSPYESKKKSHIRSLAQ